MAKKYQSIIMLFVIGLFAITSFFIFPQADDFWYAVKFLKMGFWQTQVNEYLTWNGRYVATAIVSGSPLIWGNLFIYRLLPILLIALLYLSSIFMIKKVVRDVDEKFYGLALTFLLLVSLKTPSQGLYWLAGSYTYTLSLVFVNLGLAYLWGERKTLPAILFSLLIIGCNETVMVIWLYVLVLTIFFRFIESRKISSSDIAIFAVSFAAAIFVLKAPGNAIRAGHFEKSHQIFRTLGNSALYSFIDPIRFVTFPLIGFFLLNFKELKKIQIFHRFNNLKWLTAAAWAGFIFISFAPSFWGMGRRPNERTLNIIGYFHLIGFFPVILLFVKEVSEKILHKALLVLLLISMNTFYLIKDLSGPVWLYQNRWQEIITTRGDSKPFSDSLPRNLYFKDIDGFEEDFKIYVKDHDHFFR